MDSVSAVATPFPTIAPVEVGIANTSACGRTIGTGIGLESKPFHGKRYL